jgi:Arc/MetJ family transcription regulator
MPTNLDLDDRLIDQARRVGGHKTKKAAVTAALEAYVRRAKPLNLLKHLGTIEFDVGYDHKKLRRSR